MKTQSTSLRVVSALTGAAILSFFPQASAATLYWDGNTTTAGAGNTTALLNKIWGTDSMWNTDSTGGNAGAFQTSTANTDDLFFVAGPSSTSGNVGYTVTVSGAQVANSLNFQAQGATTISGGTSITLGSGGINKGQFAYGSTAQGAVSISTAVILDSSQTWTNNSASALSVSGTLNTGAIASPSNYTLTFDGTGTTNVTGVISGTGNLVKNGTGRVSFGTSTNANSYTGTTTINGGILSIGNNSASLGSGNLTLNGGVLGFYWGAGLTRTLGTGDNMVQILGGESGFGGDGATGPTVNLGTTVVWGASGVGAATGFFNPGKFVLGSADTTNAGVITFSSGIDLNGATRTIVAPKGLSATTNIATVSGVISTSTGTAGLIKEGGGELRLSVANTYNGGTTVSEGTLSASTANTRLGSNTTGNDITVSAGARLLLAGASNVGNLQNITLNNTVTDLSVLGIAYNGLPTTAAAVTFGSNTGVLAINNNAYNTNLTSTLSGKSIFLGSTSAGTFSGTASEIAAGTGNIYRLGGGGGTLTFSTANALTGSNSVVVGSTATNGAGTVIFSAAQDYTGGLTLNAGSTIGNIGSGTYGGFGSGTVTINGGTLLFNSAANATISNNMNWNANFIVNRNPSATPTVNWDGNITLGANVAVGGSAAGAGYNQIFNGNILDDNTGGRSLSFTVSGTGGRQFVTLNGNNTFTGNLSIDRGSLTIGGSGKLGGGDYSGNISITSTATSPITYSSSSNQILRGVISGVAGLGLTKDTSTTSVLTLTGTNTYTGATTVSSGTLLVNGSIATSSLTTVASGATIGGSGFTGALTVSSGGFINPGNSPGILSTGNYTQAGLYTAEIAGTTAGTQHDQINVTGAVDITGGSLTALFTGGTYAANNLIFILLNDGADAITGTYAGLAQGATVTSYGGFSWSISYTANYTGVTDTFTGGNDIALRANLIPEPRSALLVCLGLLLLLRRKR